MCLSGNLICATLAKSSFQWNGLSDVIEKNKWKSGIINCMLKIEGRILLAALEKKKVVLCTVEEKAVAYMLQTFVLEMSFWVARCCYSHEISMDRGYTSFFGMQMKLQLPSVTYMTVH